MESWHLRSGGNAFVVGTAVAVALISIHVKGMRMNSAIAVFLGNKINVIFVSAIASAGASMS